ncbi:hypothetical protein DH2020_032962 [Rehmannia glutinosa]|uniref:Pentatricopeptide repeat-containing protein n=1 Tax=Rehmannia glutinosa TaxID=99300 RepID=A0ABR0VDN2_REHGL
MAFRSKVRSLTLQGNRLFSSSILSPDSKTPLSSKEKSRAALSLLRFEKNPERILDICRAAALNPESHLDRVAYSKAVSKLKESHYYEGIRGFIKDSLTRPDFKSQRFVSHFIVLYGQAGLVKDAINLFDEMPNMGVPNNVKAMNSWFYESGSANSAHSILAEMERKSIKPNAETFSIVIAGFYKEEKFSDVEKMMHLMKKYGMRPGISIYNVKIQSLCKLKKSSEAKALLDEILSKGMKPNCVSYGHLIYGFCREGKLDVAKSLFKEMVDKKLKPEADCYFTLVYYLCQGRDFEAALGICKECMAKGWVPNITTMKSLVDGLVSIEKIDDAKEIIGIVKEKFTRNADKWIEIEEGLPK